MHHRMYRVHNLRVPYDKPAEIASFNKSSVIKRKSRGVISLLNILRSPQMEYVPMKQSSRRNYHPKYDFMQKYTSYSESAEIT